MNIIEFVKEKGIYSFEEVPFGEVDSLVLCQLVYLKMEKIVPSETGTSGVYISDILVHELYETIYGDERYASINREFFESLSKSNRYGKLKLNNFVDVIDDTVDVQFAAMTVTDEKGFDYIVFRGTDDHVVGWREDLNMTFKIPVPAQTYAASYLERVATDIHGNFYVGGHSKGGNLAVYSSMKSPHDIRKRIISIFSHDGPGFRHELVEGKEYEEIRGRIRKYVPKDAIVGMFGNAEEFLVVECEKHGRRQHNPYNWIIDDFEFRKTEHIGKYSAMKADAILSWAADMSTDDWALLSDNLFGVFDEAGVTNLNEFNDDFLGTLAKLKMAADNVDSESKAKVKDIIDRFVDHASIVAKSEAKETMTKASEAMSQITEKAHLGKKTRHRGIVGNTKK